MKQGTAQEPKYTPELQQAGGNATSSSSAMQTVGQTAVPLHIAASTGWVNLQLGELWRYRELIYFLVWRDIKVRYRQTVLGAAWAILQPFFTMVIFSVFFGRLAKIPSDGVPYPIFAFAALLPWNLFASGLSRGADSLVGNSELVKKVYFPRLAMPLARVSATAVDFFLGLIVLFGMMFYYRVPLTTNALWIPVFTLLAAISAVGASFWLSALNVEFRDVQFITPFLVQVWFFATPVIYPSSLVPERWRAIYALNPMVGVIESFRWALLGTRSARLSMIAFSSTAALIILITGAFYFRRMEKGFADIL